MTDAAAGWQPDPTGKHEHRYWDGARWTDHVADAGVAATDPYEAADPTPPADPVAGRPSEPSDPSLDPTGVQDAAPDTTATYPTTPPTVPPPYVPPSPVVSGTPGASAGSKRGLLIGGGILAVIAIVIAVILATSGDDDDDGETPFAGEEIAELEELRDQCEAGDLPACDDLYFAADLGSDLEEFGSTCGGTADPQEGFCEETDAGEQEAPGLTDGISGGEDLEDVITESYQETFGVSEEKARCLAEKVSEAIEDGSLDEEQAMSEIFEFLEDCDISLEEIGGG
jgi:hypothetical protein